MKLYEIKNRILEHMLNSQEDMEDLSDSFLADLNDFEGDFKDKALGVAAHIKNMEVDLEGFEKFLATMGRKKKTIENKIESLRNYLAFNLNQLRISKIESTQFNIVLQESEKVTINPIVKLSDEYMVSKISWSPDKLKIADALKEGKEVIGACLDKTFFIKIN